MALLTPAIQEFVKTVKLGFIATVARDNTPNLSPKGTVTVWNDHQLVFLDIYSPGTTANLRHNPAIEINIVDTFLRRGYRFKGKGEVLSGGSLFDAIMAFYGEPVKKYPVKNVVVITVEQVLEVISPAYDTGSTESEIQKRWIDYWDEVNSTRIVKDAPPE